MCLFYAALVALSLMLGKYCLASTQIPVPPAATDLSAAIAVAPVTPVPINAAADREFVSARDAFDRHNLKFLAAARERFRANFTDYPLASYVEYWWLLASLAQSSSFGATNATDFSAFLASQPENVLAESLRREWLRALGKLERWDLFLPEMQRLNIDDSDLICHHWRYRIAQGDRSTLIEAKSFWTAARTASDACYDVFEQLRGAQLINSENAWSRVRKLLEDNHLADARKSAFLIDKLPAAFERSTASIGLNPAGFLESQKLNIKARASIELYVFALNRMARADAGKAAAALERRGAELPVADREYAWSQIGLHGAMQHDTSALIWFNKAGSFPLSDVQAAWKTRAALRAGDWTAVRAAIDAMSPVEKREPSWRYWLARAEVAEGNDVGAGKLREALARENNFYGLLAAEESGQVPAPTWKGWKPSNTDLAAILQRPAIARALLLYRLDMKPEGLKEWQFAIRNMNDQELLAAAEVARGANVPDRAINTADRTLMLHDFSQRFPMPYRNDLQTQAKAQGLDESWVYGLIRQESRFMADAKSRVGAAGLMQLMPATARWAAKRVGMSTFSPLHVADVPVNLALGSFYLRHVLDDLGHPVLATAAYNAGPGRARRWRADQVMEGAIYAESIPFTETRDYVKKVMANAWFYANQAGATNISLKRMMGSVPGRLDNQQGISSLISAMVPVAVNLPQ
ncbi:MAG: lytic transglycosylase domain-containing protein [Betaproteobacteria bacterium]|nr:lytic transglycosylase domain-containing protein [Betaproteobacteria bacterium]